MALYTRFRQNRAIKHIVKQDFFTMFLKIRVANFAVLKEFFTFATLLKAMLSLWGMNMVDIVQLVRASDCGSECRGFESHYPPSTRRNGADFICLPRFLFLIRKIPL